MKTLRKLESINPYLEDLGDEYKDLGMMSPTRYFLVENYAWAIPNEEAIKFCVSLSPIIEMGAGSGYWARLIFESGGDIICFDDKSRKRKDKWVYENKLWFDINYGSHEKLLKKEYSNHTLMLCWPEYDTPMAFNCLKSFSGNKLIYIGEDFGGCTGCDDFHDLLSESWIEKKVIYIPQYDSIYDSLFFYERKQ